MGKKGKRPRAERRMEERGIKKLMRDRERLAQLSPGGLPERPLAVSTPALVEGRASSTPCPLCEGPLEVLEHTVDREHGESLRAVKCRCRTCHSVRSLWFRIAPTAN